VNANGTHSRLTATVAVLARQDGEDSDKQGGDRVMTGSARRGPFATGPTLCSQARRPLLNLGPDPKLGTTVAELPDRPRHVLVSVLVDADGVAVREAEQFCDPVCVKEIVDVYLSTHASRLLQYSDPSELMSRLQ
jgi:hypothetical protein